ncbi:MAG: hypothetical protein GXP42_18485 [Chloroflexi bacterium]|nr:hypothetical protein [Chloroflexota bacterium]
MTDKLTVESIYASLRRELAFKPQVEADSALDLGDLRIVRNARRSLGISRNEAVIQVIRAALTPLKEQDSLSAEIFELHRLEGEPTKDVEKRVRISRASIYRHEKRCFNELAEILYRQEKFAREQHRKRQLERLAPPTYIHLFGVDDLRNELLEVVERDEPPWLILLEGLGGIGKTALADLLARTLIERGRFDEIGWVTAQRHEFLMQGRIAEMTEPSLTVASLLDRLAQQLLDDISLPRPISPKIVLPILKERLSKFRHLIIVDNLETLTDVRALAPILRELAGPSKFLLTSRRSLPSEPDVFHIPTPELSLEHALALVRHEAQLRNLPEVAAATEDALTPIYETVGGNPLALRLVVGQLRIHSLPRVLQSLRSAQGASVEALYTYIYRQAWDDLSELERRVFLLMPFSPASGSHFEHLAFVSELPHSALQDALDTLVNLNLIDRRGGLEEARYSIHSLTRTFLLEQVVKWQTS